MADTATPYDDLVRSTATKYGVDPNLALAIMHHESGGDPKARGAAGEYGLMQLMPGTAQQMGVKDPWNPEQNVDGGVRYLKMAIDKSGGNYGMAAARYNAGVGSNAWGDGVKNYVADIANRYVKLASDSPATPPRAESEQPTNPVKDFIAKQLSATAEDAPAETAPAATDNPVKAFIAKQLADTGATTPDAQPGTRSQNAIANPPQGDSGAGAIANVAGSIAQGAKDGFGTGPLIDRNMWQSSPNAPGYSKAIDTVANNTIGPVLSLAGRGINALTGAAQGGLAAAGNIIDPSGRLGADAAAMLTAPPIPELNMLAASRAAAPRGVVASDAPALPPPAETARLEPPVTRGAMPAQGPAGAPESLSAAATPQELTAMTAKEAARIGAREAQQRLTNGPPPGEDLTTYVPGSTPIPAQYAGTAEAATNHRSMLAGSEEYRNRVTPMLQAQNDARKMYFEDMAGDPVVTGHMKDDASAAFDASTASALKNATGPADAAPVMDVVNAIQKSPKGVDPVVKNKMAQVAEILTDPSTGKPYTDPSMLYGARNAIRTMLSKVGPLLDPANRETVIELRTVQKAIDAAIEPVAPGYSKGLSDYHKAMGPIEEQELLQSEFPKIVNSSGNITPDAFRNFMKRVTAGRNASGINPAKSISDENMAKLWNLYSDTQRDTNMALGKGIGSDTVQKGMGVLQLGGQMATGAARGTLAAHTGGASELLVTPLMNMLTGKKMTGRINEMLKPPPNGGE